MRLRDIYLTETHEYSSTQVDVPLGLAKEVAKLSKTIPDEDLADDGREDEPHITVKFGLTTNDPDEVREVLQDAEPFEITIGDISTFRSDEYDVVKLDIKSPGIRKLNKTVAKLDHHDTHPQYRPHITLAYVKKGRGKKYTGSNKLSGRSFTATEITFSDKNRKHTKIKL